MAIRDFKEYFYQVQAQYVEMKDDLKDFDQALQDGHITQDQLNGVLEDVRALEQNYTRLAYVMYLLNMPNRKGKKPGYARMYKKEFDRLDRQQATAQKVVDENERALERISEEFDKLGVEPKENIALEAFED